MFNFGLKPLRVERALLNKWLAVTAIFAAGYGSLNLMINPLIYLMFLLYLGTVALVFLCNARYFSCMNLAEAGRFLYLIYLVFFAVSAFFAVNVLQGIWYLVSVGLFFFFLIILFYRVSWDGNFEVVLNALFWITLTIALLSLLIRLGGIGSGLIDLSKISENNSFLAQGLAFSGLQTNQNSFGALAAVGAATSLYQFVSRRGLFWVLLSLASLALFVGLVIASTSRASMLMASVFVLLFGGALLRNRKMLMIAFLSVAGTVSAIILYELHRYIALAQRLKSGGGTSGRAEIWADAYAVGMEHFLTGVGPLQYEFLRFGHAQHAHNLYVDTFANLGFLGVLSFIIFLVYVLTMAFLKFASGNVVRKDKYAFLFSYCYLVALLMHQLFEARGFLPFSLVGITTALTLGHLLYIINRRKTFSPATQGIA